MSLVQLESFVAVAEEGNVVRAARRLHVTQPPLSRRIQSLERDLGVELFERTSRGMRLLEPGVVLLDHAREILGRVERARRSVLGAAGSEVAAPGPGGAAPGEPVRRAPR